MTEEPTGNCPCCADWEAVADEPGMSVRFGTDVKTGRSIVTGLRIERAAVSADTLRRIPLSRIEAVKNLGRPADYNLPPLPRPPGSYDDAWYKLLAQHYGLAAQASPHPAKLIAEASDVPVQTVHSWIYRARLAGYLPRGSRGKAG